MSIWQPTPKFTNLSLDQALKNIAQHPAVCGILTMGSTAQTERFKAYSDLDILIVTTEPSLLWTTLTEIEGKLTDLVFVGQQALQDLRDSESIPIATKEASLTHWLLAGHIIYDPNNLLQDLQTYFQNLTKLPLQAQPSDLYGVWFGIHYNYLQNVRMWHSGDDLYHMALRMRMLYSLSQLFLCYFYVRDMHWQGEKWAIRYWQKHDPNYHQLFQQAIITADLDDKMVLYEELAKLTLEPMSPLYRDLFTMVQLADEDNFSAETIAEGNQLIRELLLSV